MTKNSTGFLQISGVGKVTKHGLTKRNNSEWWDVTVGGFKAAATRNSQTGEYESTYHFIKIGISPKLAESLKHKLLEGAVVFVQGTPSLSLYFSQSQNKTNLSIVIPFPTIFDCIMEGI